MKNFSSLKCPSRRKYLKKVEIVKTDRKFSLIPCVSLSELRIHTTWSTFSHSHQITTDTRLPLHETLGSILYIIWCTNRADCIGTCGTDALCCVVHNSAACVVGGVTAVGLAWIFTNKSVLIFRQKDFKMEIVSEDRGAEHHLPAGVVGCGDGVVCRDGTVRKAR